MDPHRAYGMTWLGPPSQELDKPPLVYVATIVATAATYEQLRRPLTLDSWAIDAIEGEHYHS